MLSSQIEYEKPLSAPIIENKVYARLLISVEGKPTISIPLVAENNVKKINPIFRIFSAIKYLIFGTSLDENV